MWAGGSALSAKVQYIQSIGDCFNAMGCDELPLPALALEHDQVANPGDYKVAEKPTYLVGEAGEHEGRVDDGARSAAADGGRF
jgi:hypothetical protein